MFAQEPFLRSIHVVRDQFPNEKEYPFNIASLAHLDSLQFHPKVTYIVGENGMGKSTLMEAIAVAWGFNPEGGTINFNFSTRSTHSNLHDYIRMVRSVRKPKDGFFFRAESYYNLASNIDDLDDPVDPLDQKGPKIKDSYGGKSLHEQSHGESFFATFLHRFSKQGIYMMDEPEAALSPFRQMAMLARMHELIEQGAQFIISTHSPILMAYPDARIYCLTEDGVETRTLEETDHYMIMKEFVNNKERMLDELFRKD